MRLIFAAKTTAKTAEKKTAASVVAPPRNNA
jgi:hypothetical protein